MISLLLSIFDKILVSQPSCSLNFSCKASQHCGWAVNSLSMRNVCLISQTVINPAWVLGIQGPSTHGIRPYGIDVQMCTYIFALKKYSEVVQKVGMCAPI